MLQQQSFLQHTLANPKQVEPESVILDNGVCLELWASGVLCCSPAGHAAQHRVLISSGIHGNETAPIEIVDQLVSDIVEQKVQLINPVLFIIGNPVAANLAQRFVDDNMNRLFNGLHAQFASSYDAERAAQLESCVERFFGQDDLPRLHYDLHTAIRGSEFEKFAVYPFLESANWSNEQLAFLEKCGIQAVLLSTKPSGTFSYYTSACFNAHAFTVELGSVRAFGDNDMTKFRAVQQGLGDLLEGREQFDSQPQALQVFEVLEEVIKRTEHFQLHFPEDAKNFTASPRGTLLASDQDYQYITQQDGERFVFPLKNVPIGSRTMLVVAPTQI